MEKRYKLAVWSLAFMALISSAAFAGGRVDPEKVTIVREAPEGCDAKGTVPFASDRLIPALEGDSMGRRAVKKSRKALEDLQAAAAAKDADTVFIPSLKSDATALTGQARVYDCHKGESHATGGPDDSEHERIGKRFEAVAELFGVTVPLNYGSGITLGEYLTSNSLVELSAAYASITQSDTASGVNGDSTFDDYQEAGHASFVSVRYKSFVTNSFYWWAGVGDRQTSASLYYSPLFADTATKIATLDENDFGVTAAIGNQWQWSAFTLGCDWIGFYAPVVKLHDSYDDLGKDQSTASTTQSARDKFHSQNTTAYPMLVRFYLGASF